MSLSSASFGTFRLFTIETGRFLLDGGALFGVVPKTLWSRHFPSDDRNRIPMVVRCLLIHSTETGRLYLVDAGFGHKFDEKFTRIYGIDFPGHTLASSLAEHGFTETDVTDVIFTHMHFDHCGGAIQKDSRDNLSLTFPRAAHWVHREQMDLVRHPNDREKSSFLAENTDPLLDSGMLREIGDRHVYEPGLSIVVVHGHTAGQQLPLLSDGSRQILFGADLIPTTVHLPLAWVMSYDTRPLITFKEKRSVFGRCIREQTLIYLQHDPFHEMIRMDGDPVNPSLAWKGTLNTLNQAL